MGYFIHWCGRGCNVGHLWEYYIKSLVIKSVHVIVTNNFLVQLSTHTIFGIVIDYSESSLIMFACSASSQSFDARSV